MRTLRTDLRARLLVLPGEIVDLFFGGAGLLRCVFSSQQTHLPVGLGAEARLQHSLAFEQLRIDPLAQIGL